MNPKKMTMTLMLKRFFIAVLALALALPPQAQGHRKFDPARFQAELEQFIATEACLNPRQAATFFPLYREMQNKQRMLFNKMRCYQHVDTRDQKASARAIKECDLIDLQIKQVQQEYHKKFCKVLPAGVVLRIIRADEKFHRQAFQRAARRDGRDGPHGPRR